MCDVFAHDLVWGSLMSGCTLVSGIRGWGGWRGGGWGPRCAPTSLTTGAVRGEGGGGGRGGGGGGGGGVGGGQVGTMKCKNNCRLLISIVVWLILEMKKRREPDEIKISDSVILLLIIC